MIGDHRDQRDDSDQRDGSDIPVDSVIGDHRDQSDDSDQRDGSDIPVDSDFSLVSSVIKSLLSLKSLLSALRYVLIVADNKLAKDSTLRADSRTDNKLARGSTTGLLNLISSPTHTPRLT